MCPQIAFLWGCIITLVAFVWLFSTVYFEMSPQSTWIRVCIFALHAFVWFFSTVCFQMCPQAVCPRWCKVALVTFVRLFPIVCFQMSPQMVCPRRCKVTLVAFVWFHIWSPHNNDTSLINLFHVLSVVPCPMVALNWSKLKTKRCRDQKWKWNELFGGPDF